MNTEKQWILYIMIPLLLIVLAFCGTIIYLNIHPYPLDISFSMDNNTLEYLKYAYNSTNITELIQ